MNHILVSKAFLSVRWKVSHCINWSVEFTRIAIREWKKFVIQPHPFSERAFRRVRVWWCVSVFEKCNQSFVWSILGFFSASSAISCNLWRWSIIFGQQSAKTIGPNSVRKQKKKTVKSFVKLLEKWIREHAVDIDDFMSDNLFVSLKGKPGKFKILTLTRKTLQPKYWYWI